MLWSWIKSKLYTPDKSPEVELPSVTQPDNTTNQDIQEDDNSDNRKQMFQSIGSTFVEGLKVAMATLLSIFVPQFCEATGTTCTLQENFQDLSLFNEFVIVWNFISFGLFIATAIVQNKREAYFISHLDESLDEPYNALTKTCKGYPKILRRVKHYNNKLYFYSYLTMVAFLMNILFSSVLIFYFFYDGFRTVTTLVANVLLVSSRLYGIISTCKECRQPKMLALSTIHTKPVSYNVIDDNYAIETDPNARFRYAVSVKINKQSLKRMASLRKRALSAPPRPA